MNVKYIHLRYMGSNGLPITHGGITVAYIEHEAGHISYAIARCNSMDNYCRAYGRAKARGRLESMKQKRMLNSDNHSSPIQRVVFDLVERGIWNGI